MHLLTDRYLQGSLTESEESEFEERLVWDQELMDDVDLAERLRNGLRASVSENRFSAPKVNTGISGYLSDILVVPRYAAAASFLLAVTLTAGVLLNPFAVNNGSQIIPSTSTQIIPLFATRGANTHSIQFNDSSWTVLLVDAIGSYDSYRVTIRREGPNSDSVWIQDDLMPTYPDSLAIGMPGNLLAAGSYVLTVEGIRDTGGTVKTYEHIQDLPFDSDTAQ